MGLRIYDISTLRSELSSESNIDDFILSNGSDFNAAVLPGRTTIQINTRCYTYLGKMETITPNNPSTDTIDIDPLHATVDPCLSLMNTPRLMIAFQRPSSSMTGNQFLRTNWYDLSHDTTGGYSKLEIIDMDAFVADLESLGADSYNIAIAYDVPTTEDGSTVYNSGIVDFSCLDCTPTEVASMEVVSRDSVNTEFTDAMPIKSRVDSVGGTCGNSNVSLTDPTSDFYEGKHMFSIDALPGQSLHARLAAGGNIKEVYFKNGSNIKVTLGSICP